MITSHSPLLKGTRNRVDGLYDIPIYKQVIPRIKTDINVNNYKMPPLHGLCEANSLIPSHETVKLHSNTRQSRPLLPRTHINIVTQQRLQHYIFMAKKTDDFQVPQYNITKINVTLRLVIPSLQQIGCNRSVATDRKSGG